MSAATYNVSIDQGADFTMQLTIKDSLGVEIDLTAHTFTGQIRKTVSDTTVIASFSFVIADQGLNAGRVDASLSAATSSAILLKAQKTVTRKDEKMAYDIESDDGSGTVVRWLEGAVLFSPEVTRV